MYRRGHTVFFLMVLVTLALCLWTLFIFATFSGNLPQTTDSWQQMIAEADFAEQYMQHTLNFLAEESKISGSVDVQSLQQIVLKQRSERKGLSLPSLEPFWKSIESGNLVIEQDTISLPHVNIKVKRDGNMIEREVTIVAFFGS